MFQPSGRGRPPISDCCVDCHREVQAGTITASAVQPKQYGSYCRKHSYLRIRKSQNKKPQISAKRSVVLGLWGDILDAQQEHLVTLCEDQISQLFRQVNRDRATPKAFEYSCVAWCIQHKRTMTLQEEDDIIKVYGGSRNGRQIPQILGPPPDSPQDKPDSPDLPGQNSAPVESLPIRLPDPDVRKVFRATMLGGPTVQDESTFFEYYIGYYGKQPPGELLIGDETMIASDGNECTGISSLEAYENMIAKQPTERLDYRLARNAAADEGRPFDGEAFLNGLGVKFDRTMLGQKEKEKEKETEHTKFNVPRTEATMSVTELMTRSSDETKRNV